MVALPTVISDNPRPMEQPFSVCVSRLVSVNWHCRYKILKAHNRLTFDRLRVEELYNL